MRLFIFILTAYLAHFSQQSIQIELSKLKESHPEFAEYLLNNSNSTVVTTRRSTESTRREQQQDYYDTTEIIFKSDDRIGTTGASSSSSSSSRVPTPSAVTRFIYYNNETNSFEGVSMQSTYSVLTLGRNKTLTVMTTSASLAPPITTTTTTSITTTTDSVQQTTDTPHSPPPPPPPPLPPQPTQKIMDKISKSILPLYPQFVYSIRVVSLGDQPFRIGGDLIDMLNGQSIEASKIRFNMIQSLSSQLSLNQSELKLNWIDRLSKPAPPQKPSNSKELDSKKGISSSNNNKKDHQYDSNSDYMSTLYHTDDSSSQVASSYSNEYQTSQGEFDADFVADSQERLSSVENNNQNRYTTPSRFTAVDYNRDQIVLVSFSSSRLYELQRLFLENLKHLSGKLSETRKSHYEERLTDLKMRFESECERFFKQVINKHENLKFRFKLTLLSNKTSQSQSRNEFLKKVQFLKLCDLNKIYTLFKNKQYEEANTYVKNSSHEIVFNAVRLSDDYEPSSSTSDQQHKTTNYDAVVDDDNDDEDDDDDDVDEEETMMEEYGVTEVVDDNEDGVKKSAQNKIVKLKTEKSMSTSETTLETLNSTKTDGNVNKSTKDTLIALYESFKAWFWRHVPEEDFLLAVVVPVTIVISLFVLTVVVACLLHIFNNDYRVRKEKGGTKQAIISASNTTESTNSGGVLGTATLESGRDTMTRQHQHHHHHHHHKSSLNPIYKQRAYLSKGVPVILYEEMSDKPIEDYDENNADSTGGTSRLVGNYFRSPYIMRYEKPPMPAPPEYTRESLFDTMMSTNTTGANNKKKQSTVGGIQQSNNNNNNNNNDESVLNELRTMLSRDLDTSNLDYFGTIGGGGVASGSGAAATSGLDAMSKSSPSSSASPAVIDSDDNVHLLAGSSTNHRSSYSPHLRSSQLASSSSAAAQNARQSLVNEIFLANARLKQQLNQIVTYDDITTKHQLQKLLP